MDYQGNSDKLKNPINKPPAEKNLEKVVTGDVVIKKPGIGERFKNIFLGGDMKTAGQYVLADVLFPALRNLVVDAITKGTDRIVYGEDRRRARPPSYSPRVSYNNPVWRGENNRAYLPDRPLDRWQQSSKQSLEEIFVYSQSDADAIIEAMIAIVDQYEVASVADLYELLGQPCPHVYNKWGWTRLAQVSTRQTRDGYQIIFPPLEEI